MKDKAKTRCEKFVKAVKDQTYGKTLGLKDRIDNMVFVFDDRVNVTVSQCSDKQKRYLLNVARELQYEPLWYNPEPSFDW